MVCVDVVAGYLPDGLAVRIPGSHPGGPGSTPGQGAYFFSIPLSVSLERQSATTITTYDACLPPVCL